MRALITLFAFIGAVAFVDTAYGQDQAGCGTELTSKDIAYYKKLKENGGLIAEARQFDVETQKFVGITAHIVQLSNGTGGLSETQLLDAIEYLNESYDAMNITFFLAGAINYINDDVFYDFDASQEAQLTGAYNVENTINIYFFNSLSSGSSALCGYAYFPATGRDHVMMANGCTVNRGSTLPHELGHYFNLFHTHGKSNTGTTDELVDGSNCDSAGDDVCDTSADPNLSGRVNGDCQYIGENVDGNGDRFSPNPRNFMSYAPGQCRELFSNGQTERIVAAYDQFKTYLLDKYYVADFSAPARRVCIGQSINFVNESVAANSYEWTFVGGSPSTSSDPFPVVTYANEGSYDVSLTITTENGEQESKILEDYVKVINLTSDLSTKAGSFEEISFLEEVFNPDLGVTFELSSQAASEGSQSMKIPFGTYSRLEEEDFLIIDKFDASVLKQYQVSFDYAYARFDDDFYDGLSVVYKDPCGNWLSIWEKEGVDLATAADHTSSFIPTIDEWERATIEFQLPADVEVVEIGFKTRNGFGNNLFIDNYSVMPVEKSFSISELQVTDATCASDANGEINVSVAGAGSYEFSLDGSTFQSSGRFMDLAPNDYILYVRDIATQEMTVANASIGPLPISFEVNLVRPTCTAEMNGLVQIIGKGGTGSLAIEFDGNAAVAEQEFSQLSEGFYTFKIIDENGCSKTSTVVLNALNASPSKPEVRLFSTILSTTVDADIQSIQWFKDGEAIEGATTTKLTNPESGAYVVEVSNEFCSNLSEPFVILGISEVSANFNIYPSLVTGVVNISLPDILESRIKAIELIDLSGKVVSEYQYREQLDLSDIKPGLYLLRVSTDDGFFNRRLVKE